MRVYIAGPITGFDLEERQKFFASTKKWLERCGHKAINPFECHPLGVSWENALKADLTALVKCDVILLTYGWEHSRGARLEFAVALELGLEVFVDDGKRKIPRYSKRVRRIAR